VVTIRLKGLIDDEVYYNEVTELKLILSLSETERTSMGK
jgi:hypothetical protein